MNKTWSIVFGILVFVTLTSIVYAYVQQTVANIQRKQAEVMLVELEQQKSMAEASMAKSMAAEMEAIKQQKLAEELYNKLNKCCNKK